MIEEVICKVIEDFFYMNVAEKIALRLTFIKVFLRLKFNFGNSIKKFDYRM